MTYKADFVCYDEVIVELKALDQIGGREKAQVINTLRPQDISAVYCSTSELYVLNVNNLFFLNLVCPQIRPALAASTRKRRVRDTD